MEAATAHHFMRRRVGEAQIQPWSWQTRAVKAGARSNSTLTAVLGRPGGHPLHHIPGPPQQQAAEPTQPCRRAHTPPHRTSGGSRLRSPMTHTRTWYRVTRSVWCSICASLSLQQRSGLGEWQEGFPTGERGAPQLGQRHQRVNLLLRPLEVLDGEGVHFVQNVSNPAVRRGTPVTHPSASSPPRRSTTPASRAACRTRAGPTTTVSKGAPAQQ